MREFVMNLADDEERRLALVQQACEGTYDRDKVLDGEAAAFGLLYSGLDENQQATYDRLKAAGVL
jgi:hypothetical protein